MSDPTNRLGSPLVDGERRGVRFERTLNHPPEKVWRKFEWMWDGDTLHWKVAPEGGGTRLTLTTWLADPDPDGAINATAGYHVCLDQLAELLDVGSVVEVDDARVTDLEATYRAVDPVAVDR